MRTMSLTTINQELNNQIQCKRSELIILGLTKGLQHEETILCSHQLDEMINQIQKEKFILTNN